MLIHHGQLLHHQATLVTLPVAVVERMATLLIMQVVLVALVAVVLLTTKHHVPLNLEQPTLAVVAAQLDRDWETVAHDE